jgi:outer membrane protein TolC
MDVDLQVLWEFENLGFGNRARAGERRAEFAAATLDLFRTQDRVAAEIATAHANITASRDRMALAEPALREALDLVARSVQGMGQTRRVGDSLVLVVRPQEVVAAIQSLASAITDYYSAVADFNRAHFRMYRALGHPAEALADAIPKTTTEPTPALEEKTMK